MVREQKKLSQVAFEMKLGLLPEEIDEIGRSRTFQTILWTARHRFYAELANNPERNKQEAVGRMLVAIQGLMDKGEWDKAIEGILKLAKVEGWLGVDSTVNVFTELKGDQFEELKKRALEKLKTPAVANA